MVTIFIIIFFISVVIGIIKFNTKANPHKVSHQNLVYPLYLKLDDDNYKITNNDILPYAEDPVTRKLTYNLLEDYNKINLFPEKYNTTIMAAESKLFNDISITFQNNGKPHNVQYLKSIFSSTNDALYEVFQFTSPDDNKTKLAVIGPYTKSGKPYDHVHVFSSFEINNTPEQEAALFDKMVISSKDDWEFKKAVVDGEKYLIAGENIWDHEWHNTHTFIYVSDPIHKQPYKLAIYNLGDFDIKFATTEFSNCIWGLYEPRIKYIS